MYAKMEDYCFTADWFGGNIPNWRNWLGHLVGKPDVKFLEVGCYEGRATVWLLGNVLTHETARIECVDVFAGDSASLSSSGDEDSYEQRFNHNIKTALGQKKVRKIKASSQEALRKLKLHHYDAIYIDGSHTTPDVLEDAVLAFRLLKPGGIMIFDDYEWNASLDPWLVPRMAIDFFLHVYQREYELLYKGYQVALKKR